MTAVKSEPKTSPSQKKPKPIGAARFKADASNIWNMYGFFEREEVRQYEASIVFVEERCTPDRIVILLEENEITFAIKGQFFWVSGENWNLGPVKMGRKADTYNKDLIRVADGTSRICFKDPIIKNNRLRHIIATLCAAVE